MICIVVLMSTGNEDFLYGQCNYSLLNKPNVHQNNLEQMYESIMFSNDSSQSVFTKVYEHFLWTFLSFEA